MKRKIIEISVILILFGSLLFNYYLFKENQGYQRSIGAEYKVIVRNTLHEIAGEGQAQIWAEILKQQDGDILLERQLGEVSHLSREFHRMSGEISSIGILLDSLVNKYRDLSTIVKNGADATNVMNQINERVKILTSILTHLENEFGEDDMQWYKELSGMGTKTQKYVLDQFKGFESKSR